MVRILVPEEYGVADWLRDIRVDALLLLETLLHGDMRVVAVIVGEAITVRVCPMLRVTDARTVDVLEFVGDFVIVGVARIVPVDGGLVVPVLELFVLAVTLPLELLDRVDRRLHVVVPDALDVFEAELLAVPVVVSLTERVNAVVRVMLGLAEEVREACVVIEPLALPVELLEADVLRDVDGLPLTVLVEVIEPLLVFVRAADHVKMLDVVTLGVKNVETVLTGLALLVFEAVGLRVVVMVDVVVLVDVVLAVNISVDLMVFVPVVVLVEVLDCVGLGEGTILSSNSFLASISALTG